MFCGLTYISNQIIHNVICLLSGPDLFLDLILILVVFGICHITKSRVQF